MCVGGCVCVRACMCDSIVNIVNLFCVYVHLITNFCIFNLIFVYFFNFCILGQVLLHVYLYVNE